jgi:hypothetical protein
MGGEGEEEGVAGEVLSAVRGRERVREGGRLLVRILGHKKRGSCDSIEIHAVCPQVHVHLSIAIVSLLGQDSAHSRTCYETIEISSQALRR